MGYQVHGLKDRVSLKDSVDPGVGAEGAILLYLLTLSSSPRHSNAKGRGRIRSPFLCAVEHLQMPAEVTITAAEVSAHCPVNLPCSTQLLLSAASALQINLAVTAMGGGGLIFFSGKQLMFAYFRSLHKQIFFKC